MYTIKFDFLFLSMCVCLFVCLLFCPVFVFETDLETSNCHNWYSSWLITNFVFTET